MTPKHTTHPDVPVAPPRLLLEPRADGQSPNPYYQGRGRRTPGRSPAAAFYAAAEPTPPPLPPSPRELRRVAWFLQRLQRLHGLPVGTGLRPILREYATSLLGFTNDEATAIIDDVLPVELHG